MRTTAKLAFILALASSFPSSASAERAEEAKRILSELESAQGDRKARLSLVDELVGLAPTPTKELLTFLDRDHKSSTDARRALLKSIGAAVPNAKGSFRDPGKQKKESMAEADKFDWADKLADKKASATVGEALADIAAIRALARSDNPNAAFKVLKFTFSGKGILYRDEVGRYLRRGQPLSVPGLIRGMHDDAKDVRRYARYQLERVDREAPHKAMRSARNNERLALDILKAYADTLHREAIYVVLDHADHPSNTLRAAARETWNAFVTNKPKTPAPRRRLSLPGGGYTKGTSQLYFDHQTLAGFELRKRITARGGSEFPEDTPIAELTETYFKALDESRTGTATTRFDAARKAAADGDLATATAGFDAVLALEPDFKLRTNMAPTYLEHGKALLTAKKYEEAALALRKAHELAPQSEAGKEALTKAHLARARVIEAAGGDSAAELAKADGASVSKGEGRKWMMFLGIGGALAGFFLLLAGAFLRKR